MGLIPEETIEEVIAVTEIVEIVGQHVKLRRSGGNYVGLCPFHNERSPSFNVTPSKNMFKCFGCGVGGNVIKFVMEHDGLRFPEAVRRLADRAGIVIHEKEMTPEERAARKRRGALLAVQKEVGDWFHAVLLKSPLARGARDYLRGRGIRGDAAKDWLIGYAPDGDHLMRWAQENNHPLPLLAEAGLMSLRDEMNPGRGYYARFRDRVMFPITNDTGEIIAFSGRILDPDAKAAKYMNSPETPVFNKSRTLFGLAKTKRAILREKSAIVCEGQIDLITAYINGIENVIAPLGTAFTDYHARLIRRHASEVILSYDSDTAGIKAASRAFVTLATADIHVRAATMPPGEDPDTLIRSQGADAFRAITEKAPDFYDFQIAHLSETLDLSNIRDRVEFAQQIAPNVALLKVKETQDAAILTVATRLGLPPEDFRKQVIEAAKEAARLAARPARQVPPDPESPNAAATPQPVRPYKFESHTIRELCRISIQDPETYAWLRQESRRQVLDDILSAEILRDILDANFEAGDEEAFVRAAGALKPAYGAALERLWGRKSTTDSDPSTVSRLFAGLEKERLQHLKAAVHAKLQATDLRPEQRNDLVSHHMELTKEILDLEKQRTDISRRPAGS